MGSVSTVVMEGSNEISHHFQAYTLCFAFRTAAADVLYSQRLLMIGEGDGGNV